MGGSLEIRVLGPVEVLVDGRQVELGGGNERALIGYLALHPNTPVSAEAIIDALWGELPPPTAPQMVRTYVARARKRLGAPLQRRSGGYVLDVPPEAVDAVRFERLCQEGLRQQAAGDYPASSEALRRALALWRDTPLPELHARPGGSEEAARLEELRLSAIESRVEVELSLGRAAGLVTELDALVREYPHRERLRRGLMLALYRCGRQADALERYLEGRRLLVNEIGIEPGRELQQLQAAILRQDPALDLPISPSASGETPTVAPPPPGPRQTRVVVVAAICMVAIAGVVGAVVAEGPARHPTVGRQGIGLLDPGSGAVRASRALGGAPGPIAVGRSVAWVGDGDHGTVVALAASTLHRLGIARLGSFPYQLATNGSSVWVGDGFDGTLTRVDPSGRATGPFRPEPNSTGRLALAYGDGSIWIGSQDDSLTELDPRTDQVIAVTRGIGKPAAIAVSARAVWIAEATSDRLLRVGLRGDRMIESVPIGGTATNLAVGDGSVWAVTPEEGRLWRVDATTGAVTASIDVGLDLSLVAVINGQVWVASPLGTVEHVDPAQNLVARTFHFDAPIGAIAGGDGRLWMSVR